jgi:hypothetical protein
VITRLSKSHSLCLTQTGSEWSGHYTDANNASQFSGTVVTGRGITLVHFRQTTPRNDYYAVHAGKLVHSHTIKGHWYDTAGNAGAFTLECPSPSEPNRDEAIGDAINNAKHRAIASRLPKVPEPPQPEPPPLPIPELETRLKHVHHLIEVRNYPAALSQLEQLHRMAPQCSQVFNLLSQIFLQEWISYGAIAANAKAQSLNPQDEFAQVNAAKIAELCAISNPDQYHPDRPPHAQYYRLLSERYPALLEAIDQCPMIPTAGVMVDHPEQLGSYSPYQSLLGNLEPASVVGPLAGTAIAPKPRSRNVNPGRVAPPTVARQLSKPWWQRWWQWLRRVWIRLLRR